MIKPELNYTLIQVCREVGDFMEVSYRIINTDNETIQEFNEDQSALAYSTWMSYLTDEEASAWLDWELYNDLCSEMAAEDRWNRVGNY